MQQSLIVTVSPGQVVAALKGAGLVLDRPGGMPPDARAVGWASCVGGEVAFLVEYEVPLPPPAGPLPRYGVRVE